jgi:3-phosphoshikimate 1-carboxyvinyltransferase
LLTEGFIPLNISENINFEDMPDISMSFMSLAIFLPWKTKIIWLKTLNLKECKRIDVMKNELIKLWVEIDSDEESIEVWEYFWKKWWTWFFWIWKIKIETYNDHRIAMTFWVLKSYLEKKYKEKIKILNPDCVTKTYPNFWEDLRELWEIEKI